MGQEDLRELRKVRGRELALFLVVGATEGYRAVFALPELDHAFTDRIIILAGSSRRKPWWSIIAGHESSFDDCSELVEKHNIKKPSGASEDSAAVIE